MGYNLLFSFIKPIAKEVFSLIVKSAKSNKKNVLVNADNIEEAITQHLTKVNTFSSEISFRELSRPKFLSTIYIPLDLSIQPIQEDCSSNFGIEKNTFQSVHKNASEVIESVFLESSNNVILKGGPGAGKTTTLKFICQKLFTDADFLGKDVKFPILIRFREDEILNNQVIPLGYSCHVDPPFLR